MPLFARSERDKPVSATAYPSRSRWERRRLICVERPTPSVPSTTISQPDSSSALTPGIPVPYESNFGIATSTKLREMTLDVTAEGSLLGFDRFRRVHHRESVLRHQTLVFLEDPRLEQLVRLRRVRVQAEIHAGLVELELRPARQDAAQRDFERRAEVERLRRHDREAIERAHPAWRHATHDVARERGVHVPIREHDRAGFQRRHDLALDAVGEVRRVNERERLRCEVSLPFAA